MKLRVRLAAIVFLACSGAVCAAQRYAGSATFTDLLGGSSYFELTTHVGEFFRIPIEEATFAIDLTVDDAQSVEFHKFALTLDDHADIAENVYFDITAVSDVTETIDINPVMVDNKFGIKPFRMPDMQVAGVYVNRNFENEFNGTIFGGAYLRLGLDYSSYPESISLFSDSANHLLSWENREFFLEPELVLRFVRSYFPKLETIELLPVPPMEANGVIGDSNFDGVFNSGDMITVFSAGEYEDAIPLNSTWEEGDWNSDLDFNTADLIYAFQNGSYSNAVAVPEPKPTGLLLGLLWVFWRRRKCRSA